MLDSKVYELINSQINKELYSAYLYLEISNYFNEINLPGFAAWYKKQAEEEVEHAMKFDEYVYSQESKVVLEAIDKPVVKFNNAREAIVAALEHEKKVTAWINEIYLEAKSYLPSISLAFSSSSCCSEMNQPRNFCVLKSFFFTASK